MQLSGDLIEAGATQGSLLRTVEKREMQLFTAWLQHPAPYPFRMPVNTPGLPAVDNSPYCSF